MSVPLPPGCQFRICAAGMTDVFSEYTSSSPTTERAKREDIMNAEDKTARVVRLVQLSISYTIPKGYVGGKIDALELWNSGRVHWLSRKPNCPENED
jgi:hypothetical protein